MSFEDSDAPGATTPGPVRAGFGGGMAAESGLIAVLDALPEMVQLYDADWRWVYLNPPARAWMRSLGREADHLLGRHLWDEFGMLRGTRVERATLRAQREGREAVFEARAGEEEHRTRIVPFRDGFVSFTSDLTEAKRRDRRRAFFNAASAALTGPPTGDRVLDRLVVLAAENLADFAAAYEFRDGVLVRTDGCAETPAELVEEVERLVELRDRPRGLVARMTEADGLLVTTGVSATTQGRVPRPGRLQSVVLAPVQAGDSVFGVLVAGTTTAGRTPLTGEDREVFAEIARRFGLAIALERAQDDARISAARTERLQRVTAALGISLDRERTLDLLLEETAEATDAYMVAVYGREEEDGNLVLLRSRGLAQATAERYRSQEATDRTPVGDAIRERRPIFIEGAEAWRARYGYRPLREGRPLDEGAWAALPLVSGERLLGVMALGFEHRRVFTRADRAFLTALAHQCTRALERARDLYALRRSEERYRATFEHAGVGIAHVSPEGRCLRVNSRLLEILGYSREELFAAPIAEFIHPEEREDMRHRMRLLRSGTLASYRAERRYIHRDGSTVWAELTVSMVRDEEPPYLILIVEDIGARKEAERHAEERRRELHRVTSQLQLLFRATSGLLAAERPAEILGRIVDDLKRLSGVDLAFHYVVEREGEEPLLRLATSVGASEEFVERYRLLRMGESISGVVARDRRPAVLRDAEVSRDPVAPAARAEGLKAYACFPLMANGRLLGTLGFGSRARGRFGADDIAVLKAIADQLAIAMDRARSLESEHEARRQAERASQAKTAFLATVSHELRTPLNAVIGYTDLLVAGIPETIGEGALAHTRRIRVAARYLLQLIEEVLTYSRLEAGREEVWLEDVDMRDLLSEVHAVTEPLATDGGLAFVIDADGAPERVRTDPRKLRQILLNLLGNAVKFTREGEVRLSVGQVDGSAVFAVSDTGIGIDPSDFDRLFEPFWQVAGSTIRTVQGSGLGLTICRRAVELLEGSIEVRSRLGEGTTFTLRLPLEAGVKEREPADTPSG